VRSWLTGVLPSIYLSIKFDPPLRFERGSVWTGVLRSIYLPIHLFVFFLFTECTSAVLVDWGLAIYLSVYQIWSTSSFRARVRVDWGLAIYLSAYPSLRLLVYRVHECGAGWLGSCHLSICLSNSTHLFVSSAQSVWTGVLRSIYLSIHLFVFFLFTECTSAVWVDWALVIYMDR